MYLFSFLNQKNLDQYARIRDDKQCSWDNETFLLPISQHKTESNRSRENKESTISQIKKDIKAAENHTTANLWDKVKVFIEQKDYFNHPDVNKYAIGILN